MGHGKRKQWVEKEAAKERRRVAAQHAAEQNYTGKQLTKPLGTVLQRILADEARRHGAALSSILATWLDGPDGAARVSQLLHEYDGAHVEAAALTWLRLQSAKADAVTAPAKFHRQLADCLRRYQQNDETAAQLPRRPDYLPKGFRRPKPPSTEAAGSETAGPSTSGAEAVHSESYDQAKETVLQSELMEAAHEDVRGYGGVRDERRPAAAPLWVWNTQESKVIRRGTVTVRFRADPVIQPWTIPVRRATARTPEEAMNTRQLLERTPYRSRVEDNLSWATRARSCPAVRQALEQQDDWAITCADRLAMYDKGLLPGRDRLRVVKSFLRTCDGMSYTLTRRSSSRPVVLTRAWVDGVEQVELWWLSAQQLLQLLGFMEGDKMQRAYLDAEHTAHDTIGASIHRPSAIMFLEHALPWCGWQRGQQWRMVELWAGTGAMSSCCEEVVMQQFKLVGAAECDDKPREVFKCRWPGTPLLRWAHTEETRQLLAELGSIEHVHGGPECAPLSAGSRECRDGPQAKDDHRLWLEEAQALLRVVSDLQPRLVTIENAPGLMQDNSLTEVLELLETMMSGVHGYEWRYMVIAPGATVPGHTTRERAWIAGRRTAMLTED